MNVLLSYQLSSFGYVLMNVLLSLSARIVFRLARIQKEFF